MHLSGAACGELYLGGGTLQIAAAGFSSSRNIEVDTSADDRHQRF